MGPCGSCWSVLWLCKHGSSLAAASGWSAAKGLVTEAPERLRRIVEAEAEKAGARFRSVFLVRRSSANATRAN